MKYGKVQGVSLPVSKIVLGCATMPMMMGEDVSELLDAAIDCGINTFDTAHEYYMSENSLGDWVSKRNNREKIVIVTKGCHPDENGSRVSREALKEDIETSLERLKTKYIDIYMLHRDDPDIEVGEIVETLNAYCKKGIIKAFGGSNWTQEREKEANAYANLHAMQPFTVSSPNFGLAEQYQDPWGGGCTTITGKGMAEARHWYSEKQTPIFAYSSLGRGLMTGKVKSSNLEEGKKQLDKFAIQGYWCEDNLKRLQRAEELAVKKQCSVAQLAIAWMFTQGMDVYAILSSIDAKRLESNVKALGIELSSKEAAWLNLEE
jgi:aryl-alcohol dehydrogenase-like predicted oxidoreductase